MISHGCRSRAKGDDFCMGSRIVIENIAVETTADNLSIEYHHSPNRHFSSFQGPARASESLIHPEFVRP
jgi:hypothetical protein